MPHSILAVDDDAHVHSLLERVLGKDSQDYQLSHAKSPEEALKLAEAQSFPIALVDLHYAGNDTTGFALLDRLREIDPRMELIVLSSSSRFDDVRGAMRAGASDYLAKGFGRGELFHALEQGIERRRWRRIERDVLSRGSGTGHRLVGLSPVMEALRERIRKFAPSAAPVLITGETGTGKELVAANLHSLGADPAAAFCPVNCAALPASTIDSFFFGHERGAFTGADKARAGVFEEAEGGTLFLDEVNSLPLELQGRLLRVLQEKKVRRLGGNREMSVDFRLVTAANQPMEELVQKGLFRDDLFFRLGVLRIELPPLRERLSDIEGLLAALFPQRRASAGLLKLFQEHSWPGNVRELRNLLQAMDVLTPVGDELAVEYLPEHALRVFSASQPNESNDLDSFVNEQESREKEFLARAYRSAKGNVSRMARVLGADRSHLHQKLVKLGIHETKI